MSVKPVIPLKFFSALIKITVLAFFLVCGDQALAQKFQKMAGHYHLGVEVSAGIKVFSIRSNLHEINNLEVLHEVATVGLSFGAKDLVLKFRQGFYFSSPVIKYSIDELRTSVLLNYYPLNKLDFYADFRPYLTVAAEQSGTRFFGYYGEDNGNTNRSISKAPFIGKISSLQFSAGGGLEYKVATRGHYVTVFGDVRYAGPMKRSASGIFSETKLSNQVFITLGVSLGLHR